MYRPIRMMTLAMMLSLAATSVGLAQRSGMGGMGGQSAFGGGLGSSFGSGLGSSFGGGGMGGLGGSSFGSSFGNAGFGATSFGRSGFGNSGFGGTSFSNSGMGMGMGSGMYGGGMGGQNFVGRDSGDMNAVMSQMGRAGTQFFNQMSRNMGGRNNRNQNNQPAPTAENQRPPVRIRLEVGFTPPRAAPSAVATNVRTRLARLAVDHSLGNPQVAMDGGIVVLRGTAETESQRRVLERLIALEPGVLGVRNEMIVVPPASEEELPAAAE